MISIAPVVAATCAQSEPDIILAVAARLRLRPILMTSFAFILGCVPLATASGAGALSRRVMGFVVIGGMLAASFIVVFLIPVLFYLVENSPVQKKKRSP
jgi:multidrug efflux pump